MTRSSGGAARAVKGALIGGTLASLASAAVLMQRGRAETGRHWAAINAPNHWFWGERSFRRNAAPWRYTAGGAPPHHPPSGFWALRHHRLQTRRRQPHPAHA